MLHIAVDEYFGQGRMILSDPRRFSEEKAMTLLCDCNFNVEAAFSRLSLDPALVIAEPPPNMKKKGKKGDNQPHVKDNMGM